MERASKKLGGPGWQLCEHSCLESRRRCVCTTRHARRGWRHVQRIHSRSRCSRRLEGARDESGTAAPMHSAAYASASAAHGDTLESPSRARRRCHRPTFRRPSGAPAPAAGKSDSPTLLIDTGSACEQGNNRLRAESQPRLSALETSATDLSLSPAYTVVLSHSNEAGPPAMTALEPATGCT